MLMPNDNKMENVSRCLRVHQSAYGIKRRVRCELKRVSDISAAKRLEVKKFLFFLPVQSL
ncbi:hypothetical protein HBI56_136530 [Parastagonospora nodorum]|uniref:Uncharacterized protein n=1 Tax=Phaeosphaeria nodorum (strain SN15 / ATCC MYA-4574 / FGSC 10173) TaxID=321614 RepID=A0A7U2F8Y0_PHANO|nr:hypothetical protein HBH56_039620 [Parastagonospora nodorum]QRC99768.1 hypothetical protein JI435_413970 [Parastagonospora nodorum SN15]KAH3933825.1 hypothetical protein HBH54_059840 [Parastagonospora nodorum]KAH3941014.1 hypothetical protein HBH53_208440 [Parastagonospora nodorum]KAH3958054.1 hypothetical protein HBH51_216120 [Parastagonospora nodorum]